MVLILIIFSTYYRMGGGGGGGHSTSAIYSVKSCVMFNFSFCQDVNCFSFFCSFQYSIYSLYTIIKVVLLDGRGSHMLQELDA